MRKKSRPSKNDVERNGNTQSTNGRHEPEDSEAAQLQLKRKRMIQAAVAVTVTVIVAIIITVVVFVTTGGENDGENAIQFTPTNNTTSTPSPSPRPIRPPSISGSNNGKNDDESTSIPAIENSDSPTLAPSFLPSLKTLSVPPPSQLPTMTPSTAPSTPLPSSFPTVSSSSLPTTTPSITLSTSPSWRLPTTPPFAALFTPIPSHLPTMKPTMVSPTSLPTSQPIIEPTVVPSYLPTVTFSASPTSPLPSSLPTTKLTITPSTSLPSALPTMKTTMIPSTPIPSQSPTTTPSTNPFTSYPSVLPTVDNIFQNFDELVATTSNFQILQRVPHDRTAFTQGLYYDADTGRLIEGTGLYGQSLVRIWDPLTGQVFKETPYLQSRYFGEGVAWYQDAEGNERFIQLTWKEQQAFVYDTDLNLIQSFNYNRRTTTNEGWGITFNPVDKIFYVSDGSRFIHIWDLNFQLVSKFGITWKGVDGSTSAVTNLNELEWDPVSGTILSNVWYKDYIVRIWPSTGKVVKVYDMSTLESGGGDVLNGIAHHSSNKWWITGKKWRNLYLIQLYE